VTFSCAVSDDDGKARSVSPLLECLRLADGIPAPRVLPAPHGLAALGRPARRTAREHALLAGLHGSREQFAELLPEALREASELAEIPSEADDAASRLAVLIELDAPPQPRLGPYFGFVGPPQEARDPRAAPVYVTALEGMARCPWQTFLERLLRVELPPDALGPLPGASSRESGRLVGTLVHKVLEAIVAEATGSACGLDASEVLAREPRAVAWPEPAALVALLDEKAREVRRREAIALVGFDRVLAVHARRCLEVARELEWPGGRSPAAVLGGEVEGGLSVTGPQGQTVALRFRADRVDRDGQALRWLDYKTGRPFARQQGAAYRKKALLQRVRSGEHLQAAAYAAAARELGGPDGSGAYAFLAADDELDAAQRMLVADAGDEELARVFEAAAAALLGARQEGSFFPRLVEPDLEEEPRRCRFCSVKEACLRGDSGARARLERWVEERPAHPGPAERALRGAWNPEAT
jgi:hypothetical protein